MSEVIQPVLITCASIRLPISAVPSSIHLHSDNTAVEDVTLPGSTGAMHDDEFSFHIPSAMLARDASKLMVTTSDQSGIVSIFEANWNDGRNQPNLCKEDERSVRGEVDYFDGQVLRGWALNSDDPGARLSVALIIDGRLVQLKEAATLRADLRKHGTDGRHGFMFEVPTDLIDDDHSIISVRSTNPSDGIDRGLFSIDRTMLVEYSMKKLELQLKKLDRLIV